MCLLTAFLLGSYFVATLSFALPLISFTGHAELDGRELFFSPREVSSSSWVVKRNTPPPSPTTGHHLTAAQDGLIKDVLKKGIKVTPASVMNIWKTTHHIPGVDTDILFLEEGNERAGMHHIWSKHGNEFTQKGLTAGEIPHLIEQATTAAGPVGNQGKKTGRPIFKTHHNGHDLYLAITIGSNGFVVGMNPCKSPATCTAD